MKKYNNIFSIVSSLNNNERDNGQITFTSCILHIFMHSTAPFCNISGYALISQCFVSQEYANASSPSVSPLSIQVFASLPFISFNHHHCRYFAFSSLSIPSYFLVFRLSSCAFLLLSLRKLYLSFVAPFG